MLLIPPDRLDPATLLGLLETFIAREGTDYGDVELTLAQKLERLRRQVESGQVLITYDEVLETCNLMARRDYQDLLAAR